MSYIETLLKNLSDSITAKEELFKDFGGQDIFAKAVDIVVECYRSGGRLYVGGNGGSAADSQHLAAEFVSKLGRDRNPLPAEALTTDSSILTAIGNDYGFDKIFSRQIAGKVTPNDIFLGITTSGNSKNIINALDQCKTNGIKSVVFTGRDGGLVKDKADFCIIVPAERTSTIQELHILLAHTLCECVEDRIFPI